MPDQTPQWARRRQDSDFFSLWGETGAPEGMEQDCTGCFVGNGLASGQKPGQRISEIKRENQVEIILSRHLAIKLRSEIM